jgi:hypothetical protein
LLRRGLGDQIERFLAVTGDVDFEAEAAGHGGEDFPGRGIVVHHQHTHTQQFVDAEHASRHRVFLQAELGVKVKLAALADLGLHPDAAAHQLDEVL